MPSLLKTKADKPIPVGRSPHLHSRQSTSKILWETFAATVPIVILTFFSAGWNAIRIYSLAVSFGLLFEYLFQLGTGQKSRIHDGSTVLICVLFSFLIPPTIPAGALIFGIFVAVVLAKELFGGLGQNLFQPVLAGYISILALFPEPEITQMIGMGISAPVLIGVCGLFLMLKRLVRWETALVYLASATFCLYLMNLDFLFLKFSGFLFLAAFFLITDSASGPMTKEGRVLFSVTAGVLTAAFTSWMNLYQAVASAVIISNALAPLMDYFVYQGLTYEAA